MIRRWDPFREMMVLRNSVDRVADRELALAPGDWKSFNWSVALDVVESEDEYLVREQYEVDKARYHMRERRYGSFSRTIKMPSGIENEEIKADYDKGVLELHLPKVEEVKPKKIAITTSSTKVIDAKAADSASEN